MDTSKEYVKMHKALPKSMRKEARQGERFYDPKNPRGIGVWGRLGEEYSATRGMMKLYEQDELQAMVNDNMNQVVRQVGITNCLHFRNLTEMLTMSWEQLWLSFIMKQKYNKVWSKNKWVLENLCK